MNQLKGMKAFRKHIRGMIGKWTVRSYKNGLGWTSENWTEEFYHNGVISHIIEHAGTSTRVMVP